MIVYLDTSALAKLLIREPGSGAVAAAVSSALAVATHRITYVEIHATLARAARLGRIQASSLEHRLRDFETRWASLDVVDLTGPMVRRAWLPDTFRRPVATEWVSAHGVGREP